jgi:glycosyltransferase involved in cell wall biosynthesis
MRETVCHEENALLFEPRNVGELASCIVRLMSDGALRGRLIRGGQSNARRFSAAKVGETLEEIYAGLITPSHTQAGIV